MPIFALKLSHAPYGGYCWRPRSGDELLMRTVYCRATPKLRGASIHGKSIRLPRRFSPRSDKNKGEDRPSVVEIFALSDMSIARVPRQKSFRLNTHYFVATDNPLLRLTATAVAFRGIYSPKSAPFTHREGSLVDNRGDFFSCVPFFDGVLAKKLVERRFDANQASEEFATHRMIC